MPTLHCMNKTSYNETNRILPSPHTNNAENHYGNVNKRNSFNLVKTCTTQCSRFNIVLHITLCKSHPFHDAYRFKGLGHYCPPCVSTYPQPKPDICSITNVQIWKTSLQASHKKTYSWGQPGSSFSYAKHQDIN